MILFLSFLSLLLISLLTNPSTEKCRIRAYAMAEIDFSEVLDLNSAAKKRIRDLVKIRDYLFFKVIFFEYKKKKKIIGYGLFGIATLKK